MLALLAAAYLAAMPSGPAIPPMQGTESARWNLPGSEPHLLAHYMPWFRTAADPGPDSAAWDHWRWDGPGPKHDPEKLRAHGKRDIAAVYYPLIGTYDSRSRAVIRYHLETMRAAGIEGVVIDWYGVGTASDEAIPAILEEAQKLGMKAALCYEEKTNFLWRGLSNRAQAVGCAKDDIRYVLTRYAISPAYLRRNGMPVILQFDGWGDGKLGPNYFTSQELGEILQSQPERVAYCRQGIAPEYFGTACGAFQWWSSSAHEIRHSAETAATDVHDGRLGFFVTPLAPGFDDKGVWGWGEGRRVTPRAGLSLLRASFDLAFDGSPELIQIVTWNDFNEGTNIEPTRENGYLYIDAIATWWAAHSGGSADLAAIRQPLLRYAAECSPAEREELPASLYHLAGADNVAFTGLLARRSLFVKRRSYLDKLDAHRARHAR